MYISKHDNNSSVINTPDYLHSQKERPDLRSDTRFHPLSEKHINQPQSFRGRITASFMSYATYSAPNLLQKLHSTVLKLPLRREQVSPLLGRKRRLPPSPPPRRLEPASASKHALRQA